MEKGEWPIFLEGEYLGCGSLSNNETPRVHISPPAVSRRARDLASSHLVSSQPAIWLAGDLRGSELAPNELVGWQPCQLATCELSALVHPMDFLLLALTQSNCSRN
ncbi:UNVERIFIED_CONTAM: hypothetical protein Sradi_3628900 [Sesamum radiatum]|uniref:Uncharacterized protein n=1 Tax=Sesamum radiatum TaxID=300843 RepID=A0AAW2QJE3_SESRA